MTALRMAPAVSIVSIGVFAGWQVVVAPFVPWMRPLQLPASRTIVAREAADVLARVRWEAVKTAMRADLRARLDEFAGSVGVPS